MCESKPSALVLQGTNIETNAGSHQTIQYIVKKSAQLKLAEDQKALLIWDVFQGQLTEKVKQTLISHHIQCAYVPVIT